MVILTWMIFFLIFHMNVSCSRKYNTQVSHHNPLECRPNAESSVISQITEICKGANFKRAIQFGPEALKNYMDWKEIHQERLRSRGDSQPFQNLMRSELEILREGKMPKFDSRQGDHLISKELLDFLLPEADASEFLRPIPTRPHNWALEIFGVNLPDLDYFFFSIPKEWKRRQIDPRAPGLAANKLRRRIIENPKDPKLVDAIMQCCNSKCDDGKFRNLDIVNDICS